MFKGQTNKVINSFKYMNFDHLMSIYETNFYNFKKFISIYQADGTSNQKSSLVIESIFHDKYTEIFKMYHNFPLANDCSSLQRFAIKTHLVFYMYNDAKLLEVKSLRSNKTFNHSLPEKLKLNLNLFYWLKFYINQ